MRALLVASVVLVVGIMATVYVLAFPTANLSGQPHALIAVEPPSGDTQSNVQGQGLSGLGLGGQQAVRQPKIGERLPRASGDASALAIPGGARAPGSAPTAGQAGSGQAGAGQFGAGQLGNRQLSANGAPEPAGIPGLLIAPMPVQGGGQPQ